MKNMQEYNVQQKTSSKTKVSNLVFATTCSLLGFIILGFGIFLFIIASSTDTMAIAAAIVCIGLLFFKPAVEYHIELSEE
jgi:membrane protein YdbS with pleckstrin-like domain